MTTLLINALATIVRMLVTADVWKAVSEAVANAEETGASGEKKRAAVISTVRTFGVAAAGWAINLAIETAVAKLNIEGQS